MQEQILEQAAAWLAAGEPIVLATIVHIRGTSSQPLGARMAITRGDRFVGAVSSGCVEGDVYHQAVPLLASSGARMVRYRHVENPLIAIGLNCEGQIEVLLERVDAPTLALLRGEDAPPRSVLVTLCDPAQPDDPRPLHMRVLPEGDTSAPLPEDVRRDALAAFADERPRSVRYPDGRVALLEPRLPPPTLLIFGGEAVAVPLVKMAKILGFRTVVSDARAAFATREKHPDADAVIAAWPEDMIARVGTDARTYVVSLNHEPRFEDALFRALVGRPLAYLGAIGKPERQAEREARAAASDLDLGQLPPIHTPIGLDIGGKSAEEIALSILAEVVAVRNGRSGGMASAVRRARARAAHA